MKRDSATTLIALIKIWKEKGILISLNGENLKVFSVNDAPLSREDLENIKLYKQELISYLSLALQQQQSVAPIPAQLPAADYPASSGQKRLWFMSQLPEGNIAYNMGKVYYLRGNANITALQDAFRALLSRHEILRTNFRLNEDGEVRQFIRTEQATSFHIHADLSHQYTEEDGRALIAAEFAAAFALESDWLVRVKMIHTDAGMLMMCVLHHIVADAWSMDIMMEEMQRHYLAFAAGQLPELLPLKIQYRDYACWEQSRLQGEAYEKAAHFWKSCFQKEVTPLMMPGIKSRPAIKSYAGKTATIAFSPEHTVSLLKLSQAENISMFILLQAILKGFLFRYTGQDDIVIGTPVSARTHEDLHNHVGFFLNTIALRTEISCTDTCSSLLKKVKEQTDQAYLYQDYPFDLAAGLNPDNHQPGRSPLFDVMLVFQHAFNRPAATDTVMWLEPVMDDKHIATSKFDLSYFFHLNNDNLVLTLEYNTGLFNEAYIGRLLAHLHVFSQAFATQQDLLLTAISYLTVEEERQLNVMNNTTASFNAPADIITLLEDRMLQFADRYAVTCGHVRYSYADLQSRINRLAGLMEEKCGVIAGVAVGVMLPRSEWSVISMLAILKSGAVYVPLDYTLPASRLSYMIQDSGQRILLKCPEITAGWLEEHDIVTIDITDEAIHSHAAANKKINIDGSSVSYMIYTSGSTGTPKGVEQTYLTLYNLICWNLFHSPLKQGMKHLQYSSFGFDMALHDVLFTLCSGGELYVLDAAMRDDIPGMARYIREHAINRVSMSYTALQTLFSETGEDGFTGHRIQEIISTGEQLYINAGLSQFLKANPAVSIYNYYGPTETHVVTAATFSAAGTMPVIAPVGFPVSNTTIHILDNHGQRVAVNMEGELYIGGHHLARGYKGNEALTLSKFTTYKGERVYRTGDIGMWLEDGSVAYTGRNDDQIKIRGYRIEPGEVRNVLLSVPGIEDAVIRAVTMDDNRPVLMAWLVAEREIKHQILHDFLEKQLPPYMIPAAFIQLPVFPVNANGKVNMKLLPVPLNGTWLKAIPVVLPQNETEEHLLKIFEEILGVSGIGVTHNFFEHGGHSLKSMIAVARINKQCATNIGVRTLYEFPDVRTLAIHIQTSMGRQLPDIPVLEQAERVMLSPGQEMLLLFDNYHTGNTAYNILFTARFKIEISLPLMDRAINFLINRYEILRTAIGMNETGYYQRVLLLPQQSLEFEDLQLSSDPGKDVQVTQSLLAAHSFDLQHPPLYRFRLLKIAEDNYVMVAVFHHVILDGWSASKLLQELFEIYTAMCGNQAPALPALRIQYGDYASWHQQLLKSGALHGNSNYWQQQFIQHRPEIRLPYDFPVPDEKTFAGAVVNDRIDKAILENMTAICRKENVSLFTFLLSGIVLVLHRWTSYNCVAVGIPAAGRFHPDMEDQVGYFVNMLPMLLQVSPDLTFSQWMKQVQKNVLNGMDNQMIPYMHILEGVRAEDDINSLYNVVVNMSNIDLHEKNDAAADGIRNAFEILPMAPGEGMVKNELTINLFYHEDHIDIGWAYAIKLFRRETIVMLNYQLENLWKIILTENDPLLKNISLLENTMPDAADDELVFDLDFQD